MYLRLTPETAVCSAWSPRWPHSAARLLRIRDSRTFPISHPSTRLCLDLLIQTCRERHVGSLLDVGCGSGILSLVGAVLGVPFAVGCDLNLAAIQVSRNNARQFQMPGRVFWIHGSTEALKSPFHLVVANLPFTVQMAKREEFGRLVHPRGGLILSGFRDTREKDLTDYYLSRGWRLQRRLTKDRWELELPEDRSYTWVGLYFAV